MSCVILQRRVPRRSVVLGVAATVLLVLGVLPITLCWVSMKALASPACATFLRECKASEMQNL